MSKRTKDDVIAAAGRLFAERGYHGTSMRDLGRELGLVGSSLYSHIEGKQDLLIEVIERGAVLFQDSADAALASHSSPPDQLRALIAGHVAVVLDHRDEVRTFLNEASALDPPARRGIVAARDRYEQVFRSVLQAGAANGSFRPDLDPIISSIFILSILNAVDRWYDEAGLIDRGGLVERIYRFSLTGLSATPSV